MAEPSKRVVSEVPGLRASLTEVLLLTLAVALGVNFLSTALTQLLPSWVTIVGGALLVLAPVIYVIRNRFRAVVHSTEIEGFVLYDKEANELVSVPTYDLAEEAVRYLSAAFAENPAFKRQWDEDSILKDWSKPQRDRANRGEKLMNELIEYIVLDRLSMSIGDHFNRSGIPRDNLRTYSRSDLPEILLKNRFLELFSRDPADREGFESSTKDMEDGWVLVSSNSSTGGYYHRFELTLPADSAIKREPNGTLLIEGPHLTARIRSAFPRYGGKAPYALQRHFVGVKSMHIQDLAVEIEVEVQVKRQLFLRADAIRYSAWIEVVLDDLTEALSGDRFLERIQWTQLEAAVQVFDREERGRAPKTTSASRRGSASVKSFRGPKGSQPKLDPPTSETPAK